ncbi:hypothetical protein E6H21_08305 [Candidatus Bathyarchaeota archaeon]|nr:MAG: hypothetical protein E6H21_08305 [Candidatus Bathyarchaeota archaeon]
MRQRMPSFVALLKISGRVEGAKQRLQKLPERWLGCTTEKVIFGTGGYDAVVVFVAPDIVEANQYIDKYLRDSDPLTMIDTVTGESIRPA